MGAIERRARHMTPVLGRTKKVLIRGYTIRRNDPNGLTGRSCGGGGDASCLLSLAHRENLPLFIALQRFRKTLSVRHFFLKNWVAGPQQPWSIASRVYNRDGGRYWSCTLVHTSIICIYGRPRLLHN